VFGALKKMLFSKGAVVDLNQSLKAFTDLSDVVKIDVANYVLNFIAEADDLSRKVSNTDVLAANLSRFASELRESRVAAGATSRSDEAWLKYALCESYAIAFSSRMDDDYRRNSKQLIASAMHGVFRTAANQNKRSSRQVLPKELCEFVLRY
jgi:hypothetical protein